MRLILFHLSHPVIAIALPYREISCDYGFSGMGQKASTKSYIILPWRLQITMVGKERHIKSHVNGIRISKPEWAMGYIPWVSGCFPTLFILIWIINYDNFWKTYSWVIILVPNAVVVSLSHWLIFLKNKDKRGKQIVHWINIIQIAGNNSCNVPFSS